MLQWRHRWGVMTKLSPAAGEYVVDVINIILVDRQIFFDTLLWMYRPQSEIKNFTTWTSATFFYVRPMGNILTLSSMYRNGLCELKEIYSSEFHNASGAFLFRCISNISLPVHSLRSVGPETLLHFHLVRVGVTCTSRVYRQTYCVLLGFLGFLLNIYRGVCTKKKTTSIFTLETK